MLIVVLNFNKIYSEFNSTLGLLCTFKNRKKHANTKFNQKKKNKQKMQHDKDD